jgi:LuxR family transcriptional regulator, maltose regulon positive regulatory protein
VSRARLLATLARRWDVRLVTVRAGPGFGKTTLLGAAASDVAGRPAGASDVWLTCEPADRSADHLVAGLASAAGLAPDASLEAVLDWVWVQAPTLVCFLLDEVHEVPAGTGGAEVLARVVTDLPGNGHLVLASREVVPVPTARLAASGELVRVLEDDLLLDDEELEAFASAREVPTSLLATTGGWPALAELTASAGADLVLDYLWEEVLAQAGPERGQVLARLAVVGEADDEILSTLAGRPARVDVLTAGIPLVERSELGWVRLHRLWAPALRPTLTDEEVTEARRRAAGVHARRGRHSAAVSLLVEAEDWDAVLATIRETELTPELMGGQVLGGELLGGLGVAAERRRWCRMLPGHLRSAPEVQLAEGLARRERAPTEALVLLAAAAEGFREAGLHELEVAAIGEEGLVRWWMVDLAGLLTLVARLEELAADGSRSAAVLLAVGHAAMAHLGADSDAVLSHLQGIEEEVAPVWVPTVRWLRSVAHRRDGRLAAAYEELDAALGPAGDWETVQLSLARLRIDWLVGEVDHVCRRLPEVVDHYRDHLDRYPARDATLELAAKVAWMGDAALARELVAGAEALVPDLPSPLADILRAIAVGALAIAEGDETAAAAGLRELARTTLGRPEGWFWRDRAAIALLHVLLPETREAWASERLGPAHLPGLRLAEALEMARAGDLSVVAGLAWPPAGVVRAHLPPRWAVELAVAGIAAGNPPAAGLLQSVGDQLRPALRALAGASPSPVVSVVSVAKQLLRELPAVPAYHLHAAVIGPLEVTRDGEPVVGAELRRPRVRELLTYLIVHPRARREAVAAELWPDLDAGRRNLRVTLSYLQKALQPERDDSTAPYFVHGEGAWLALGGRDRLTVDVWQLDALLDEAASSERDGAVADALGAYREALHLWRGEPFADVPYADWAAPERVRVQERYTAAALRAGELLLAAGDHAEARSAAEHALAADPGCEPAHRLVVRTHLADWDLAGARRAVDACRAALAQLDLEPGPATTGLLDLREPEQAASPL